jgi:uncharacterized membrane protein
MKNEHGIYKALFIAIFAVFGLIALYTIKSTEIPRLILFLGRFHPVLLHLPIGVLVVTFFIDMLGRIQKEYPVSTIKNLLGFTALSAIATCFLGYFLSLEGGYEQETLELHFYTGILTAALATVLFVLSLKPAFNTNKLFLPLFFVALISLGIAGHLGSVLTHGAAFLTEYATAPEKEKTIEVVDSLRLYKDVVGKILDQKCVPCHNATKKKGALSLLTKTDLLKGGVHGPSIVGGDLGASLLHTRLLLPISNEEHMPPEGKEQLTKDEIWLLEHWIKTGADFESKVTNVAGNNALKKRLEAYLVFNKIEIPKAAKSDIEKVKNVGFRVFEIVPNQAELNVKYVGKIPTKKILDTLSVLKDQITELDFSTAEVSDEMTPIISQLSNLKMLRLNSPKITDKTLKQLKGLTNLEVLNLYNTGISNQGLSDLLSSIQPDKIYTWGTEISKDTAKKLAANYDISIQNELIEGFVKESQLEIPTIFPQKSLFKDTLYLEITSKLKDVDLRYTLNGTDPDSSSAIVKGKIMLGSSKTLKVKAFKTNWRSSEVVTRQYAKITHEVTSFAMKKAPDERYPNPEKLFDLKEGSLIFDDGHWLGYLGDDLETTIDLGSVQTVHNLTFRALEDVRNSILYPKAFIVYTSNRKNGAFKKLAEASVSRKGEDGEPESKKINLAIPNTSARYFKVVLKNHGFLPRWHASAGNKSWLLVDEIYFW